MPGESVLLAVPNVSEGRDGPRIDAIARAFTGAGRVTSADTGTVADVGTATVAGGTRLLDVHSDADHHRSVFTLAGYPGTLASSLLSGAAAAVKTINVGIGRDSAEIGRHPHVGAIDVVPVVYLDQHSRGVACAEALVVAEEIGERLGVPVFIYGELSGGRTRAALRRGGVSGLAARIASGELHPDFGPPRLHPTAGATLVAARPPLVAFNLELAAPATVREAAAIAARIREGGPDGLPGLRAIGVELTGTDELTGGVEPRDGAGLTGGAGPGDAVAQVSMNVERPLELSLAAVVLAVSRHAPVVRAELVGLAPRAALEGFPADLPMPGFDPARHVIENALGL
jgi:glutamate formiminotransferase